MLSDATEKYVEFERNRPLLLEALSDQLLHWGLVDTWREAFVDRSTDAILFVERPFTILCSDLPSGLPDAEAIETIARRHGGSRQPARRADIALSFDDPVRALRMAVLLQRLAHKGRLRTAIGSGNFVAALLAIHGELRPLVLDGAVAAVEREALATAPGSIHVAPATYEELHTRIPSEAASAMVVREMHGEEAGCATLTLPPAASAELSTFAGLGLT